MYTQKLKAHLFQKRADLSFQIRFLIAYIVSFQCKWGTITRLSRKYNVSRTFIYNLQDSFLSLDKNNFQSPQAIEKQTETSRSLEAIFSLRFEGKCSIESISTIMNRFGFLQNSVGFISQTIKKIGDKIGSNLIVNNPTPIKVVFCSDEIFARQAPILITVDPVSLTILNIELATNRKGTTWEQHWSNLISQGYIPLYLAKDEGIGMDSAQKVVLSNTGVQSDTYHAVAHCLGLWNIRLQKAAYKAIESEYECFRLWDNAKSEDTLIKRTETYEKAIQETFISIELYETFERLYYSLLECFENFDSEGKLKNSETTMVLFNKTLESIKLLKHKEINEEVKSIENCKKDLFYFTKVAKEVILELSQTIDNETLQSLCLAWQVLRNSVKLKNQSQRKNALKRKEQYILEFVKERLGEKYEIIKNQVYERLEQIVQSSAAVECINSILRPYLNTIKNQPTQEFLNLFMFYHNHRRFSAGKRKGKTPIELLTGQSQSEDWLKLLFQ